jgi:hypothetical protein
MENPMNRSLVALIVAAFCASAAAQTPAPTDESKADKNKAKQEMVQGTTKADATQSGVAPYRGQKATGEKQKMTREEKQKTVQSVSENVGASQYGTTAGKQAAKADKSAPKAAKPDMSDPKVRDAMEKQKH